MHISGTGLLVTNIARLPCTVYHSAFNKKNPCVIFQILKKVFYILEDIRVSDKVWIQTSETDFMFGKTFDISNPRLITCEHQDFCFHQKWPRAYISVCVWVRRPIGDLISPYLSPNCDITFVSFFVLSRNPNSNYLNDLTFSSIFVQKSYLN